MTFFTKRGGTIPSTEGGRGRTTAAGRERRDLLDMNLSFFALKSRKGVRGRLGTFAMVFFAFKSKRPSGLLGLLIFKFSNSSRTNALVRADM